MKRLELVGHRFGRLVVESFNGIRFKATHWTCRCDCGAIAIVSCGKLRNGHTQSCGCLARDVHAAKHYTHGKSGTKIFNLWNSMLTRCNNEKCDAYPYYGGRGITVCERWMDFENFLADMGEPDPGMTLDRRNNDIGYCKENCRWVDRATQRRNRGDVQLITFRGKSQMLCDWAAEFNLPPAALYARINKLRWPLEKAITTPSRNRHLGTMESRIP